MSNVTGPSGNSNWNIDPFRTEDNKPTSDEAIKGMGQLSGDYGKTGNWLFRKVYDSVTAPFTAKYWKGGWFAPKQGKSAVAATAQSASTSMLSEDVAEDQQGDHETKGEFSKRTSSSEDRLVHVGSPGDTKQQQGNSSSFITARAAARAAVANMASPADAAVMSAITGMRREDVNQLEQESYQDEKTVLENIRALPLISPSITKPLEQNNRRQNSANRHTSIGAAAAQAASAPSAPSAPTLLGALQGDADAAIKMSKEDFDLQDKLENELLPKQAKRQTALGKLDKFKIASSNYEAAKEKASRYASTGAPVTGEMLGRYENNKNEADEALKKAEKDLNKARTELEELGFTVNEATRELEEIKKK